MANTIICLVSCPQNSQCTTFSLELAAKRDKLIAELNTTFVQLNQTLTHEHFQVDLADVNADARTVHVHILSGLAMGCGAVLSGLLIARPSAECRVSRKYVSQTSLAAMSAATFTSLTLDGHCSNVHVALTVIYSAFFGALMYASKMLNFERVRARFFARAWSFVTWSQAIPVVLGNGC